jgi:hypothetical protein
MRENRETKMLLQGILMWLLLAFASSVAWLLCAAVVYFAQPAEVSLGYRLFGAATGATVAVSAFFALARLTGTRRG